MAKQNKTTENENSVTDYVNGIADKKRRNDALAIIEIMQQQTGLKAKMWGTGIVGFGSYHYKYESGREGDAPAVAFAVRAKEIVLYLSLTEEKRENLLSRFGKHKTGKGCVYIQKIEDVDTNVLNEMIIATVENNQKKYS